MSYLKPESFFPEQEARKSPALERLTEVYQYLEDSLNEELMGRHRHKPYHSPEHTLREPEGVVPGVQALLGLLETHMSESLELQSRSGEEQFSVICQGVEAGARAHDVVIEIEGVSASGQVIRSRGWKEGGNEYESYIFYRQKFIEKYADIADVSPEDAKTMHGELMESDAYYNQYMTAVEETIRGTDPDAIGMPLVPEDVLATLPPEVAESLKNQSGEAKYLRLDSTKTKDSLQALISSTADLLAAAHPERFSQTGNGEFWELNVLVSERCADFVTSPGTLSRTQAREVISAMRNWRQIQIGVALGQKIRLAENFSVKNISDLFGKTFGREPDINEVTAFVASVLEYQKGIDISIQQSQKQLEYFQTHFALADSEDGVLSEDENTLVQNAIVFMGGEDFSLKQYVAEVKEQST